MSEPTRAGDSPKMEELEAGKTYAWCACGNSKNQPYCDGSHAGTEFSPVIFEAEGGTKAMCMCKKTANAPYCDGSHSK
jgi:CDGSH-type Zn-finger protein